MYYYYIVIIICLSTFPASFELCKCYYYLTITLITLYKHEKEAPAAFKEITRIRLQLQRWKSKVDTMVVHSKSVLLLYLIPAMISQRLSFLSFQPTFFRNISTTSKISAACAITLFLFDPSCTRHVLIATTALISGLSDSLILLSFAYWHRERLHPSRPLTRLKVRSKLAYLVEVS